MRCCVPGCGQRSEKGISFHRFPVKDPNRSQQWVDRIYAFLEMHNCKPERLKKTKQSVLCSKHFLNSDYLVTASGRMLKLSACPSVFLCDPNAPKRRNRQPKSSSKKPEPHRLHYILPKVKIDEGKKVMATVQGEENKKNVSYTQEVILDEPMSEKATIKEPMLKESPIEKLILKKAKSIIEIPMIKESPNEKPILKKAKVAESMLEQGIIEVPMLDQGTVKKSVIEHMQVKKLSVEELRKNACTGCLTLKKKVQTLEERIAYVEKLFQLQSCNTRDISSSRQEELLQGSTTLATTTQNARHDHCYISSPQSLRRKLDFTRAQKIMTEKVARSTMKKYRQATIKVLQLKHLLKIMKEKMIAKPEVVAIFLNV